MGKMRCALGVGVGIGRGGLGGWRGDGGLGGRRCRFGGGVMGIGVGLEGGW